MLDKVFTKLINLFMGNVSHANKLIKTSLHYYGMLYVLLTFCNMIIKSLFETTLNKDKFELQL